MRVSLFAKIPTFWIRNEVILSFSPGKGEGSNGTKIAAIKIYMVLCLHANYTKNERFPEAGCAQLSYTQLQKLAGLSRPVVARALAFLSGQGLIQTTSGSPAIYRLEKYDEQGSWGKLPKRFLSGAPGMKVDKIDSIPNRGKKVLFSLQLYLYIIANVRKGTHSTQVTHVKINEKLNIPRPDIRAAISLLIELDLIVVTRGEEAKAILAASATVAVSDSCNTYTVRGFDKFGSSHRETQISI